jgi:hypothetical protein
VKDRVNAIALAPEQDFRRDSDRSADSSARPEVQRRLRAAIERGFQTRVGELTLDRVLGDLAEH